MRDFTVEYPGFTLGPVTLALSGGERIALVGPNGAGKSTLLKGLAGLIPGARGRVELDGVQVVEGGAQARRGIGILHEKVMGFGWMTVAQHLSFLAPFYPTWDARYAAELLRRLDLPPDTKLADLSKGMGVKLSLVAAEAHRPGLLLLDEPTSGLDPLMRSDVLDLIASWAPRHCDRAVVFSSHILEDLETIADRVVMVRGGRILLDAPVAQLQDPQSGRSLARALLERLSHD
ncbi:MAG TPA: ABC transporter ATP-binding protein [Longimicrobiales bacterium]|nr:ABC transporter ATP-binding protein [Longimicrobiales bacterium]